MVANSILLPAHMYESCHTHKWVMSHRPTQLLMYIHSLIYRFQVINLLILQYKYKKSCAEDQMLLDLILRMRLCSMAFDTHPLWLFDFFISTWPKCSGCNILYQSGTSAQRTHRRGWSLNIFTWFIGSGGIEIRHVTDMNLCDTTHWHGVMLHISIFVTQHVIFFHFTLTDLVFVLFNGTIK